MRYSTRFTLKGCKKFSCILIALFIMLLISMMVTACDGSCNGVGNCSCNGNASCDGGSIPFMQQQTHSTKSGDSGSATIPNRVRVQLASFKPLWSYTSDDNYSLRSGLRIHHLESD